MTAGGTSRSWWSLTLAITASLFIISFVNQPRNTMFLPLNESTGFSNAEALTFEHGYSDLENPRFLQYISNRWITRHTGDTKTKRATGKNVRDLSQAGQGHFVDRFFRRMRNGVFVEAGAYDGRSLSNTLFLEQRRNWSGLLVEANREAALLQARRRADCSHVCLSTQPITGRQKFTMAGLLGGITAKFSLEHTQFLKSFNTKKYEVPGFVHFSIDCDVTLMQTTVPCTPLYALLLATGRTHVDYLSLDVEGAEVDILRTIPFHKVKVKLIGVEYRIFDGLDINGEESVRKLGELRRFFRDTGQYEEVGIVPWGSHDNKQKKEERGLDVFFARL